MMKHFKKIFLILSTIVLVSHLAFAQEIINEARLQQKSTELCDTLKQGNRSHFTSLVAASRQQDIRWWWDASGKGKDFRTNFTKCAYHHWDKERSKQGQYKVFIQRYDENGPWSLPAPVVFDHELKIVSYSL